MHGFVFDILIFMSVYILERFVFLSAIHFFLVNTAYEIHIIHVYKEYRYCKRRRSREIHFSFHTCTFAR